MVDSRHRPRETEAKKNIDRVGASHVAHGVVGGWLVGGSDFGSE